MSSSHNSSNCPADQSEISTTLYFLHQLPFCFHFSDRPMVDYLGFSSAFHHISVPLNSTIQYRDIVNSPFSDSSFIDSLPATLSPTNTTGDHVIVPALVQSFDRLSLREISRQRIKGRIEDLELELRFLTLNLISQRERANLIIDTVTNIAINSARSRYIPQIKQLQDLLQRSA